ncbi:nuclear fragile X mental retardation-interacting protein 1 [Anopheles aquasalis]|uniref:nuclear fragile X mental retardation-interacting protein 1 n=1 Tax=Anopheles aquasalis TaxID=42839 RepID=UPI00215A8D00|nr:nuclear fragile X mental retardation-interacting protein 1 [Anopheles aquasalis]
MEGNPPSGTPDGTNPAKEFRLPAPKFKEEVQKSLDDFSRHLNPHFSTPTGMLLPREMQPPPMYGPRGSTLPPQFLANNRRKRPSYDHQFGQPAPKQPQYEPRFHRGGHHQRPPTSFRRGNDGNHHRSPRGNEGFEKDVIPALLLLNWKLWCEGCDVNCTSEEEYQRHIESHRPCEVPSCSFVGHPMVMKKHARKAHSEESSNDSRGMPSAEEIEQWKEERRKRFPTKQNIILRQLAQEERLKRGERIGENKERFPLKPGSNRPAQDGIKDGPKPKKRKRRGKQPVRQVENQSTPRIMFAGTSGLDNYLKPIANCLSLLQGYGSDSENESEENSESEAVTDLKVDEVTEPVEEVPNVGDSSQTNEQASPVQKLDMLEKQQEIQSLQANTLGKADVAEQLQGNAKEKVDTIEEKQQAKPETNTIENASKQNQKKQFNRKQQHNSKEKPKTGDPQAKKRPYLLDYSKLRRSNQNTMLEKLLDADIRHERNVLLQCVRFVVSNNFFGVGQPKVEKDGATNIQNENPSQAQNDATAKIEIVEITPPQNDGQTLSQSDDIARTEKSEFPNSPKDVQAVNEGASSTLNEAAETSQIVGTVTSESNANGKE